MTKNEKRGGERNMNQIPSNAVMLDRDVEPICKHRMYNQNFEHPQLDHDLLQSYVCQRSDRKSQSRWKDERLNMHTL
jgi:hypothetical protein